MFYFTPQQGFFSPFLRSTISLSVTQEYLALRGGPRWFIRDFTCPILLGNSTYVTFFLLLDFHHLWCRIQLLRLILSFFIFVFPLPLFTGLGWSRFARRYYGNRVCFLFLQLLRCFNSLGCLYPTYEFIGSSRGCPIRVSSDQSLLPAPRSVSPVSAPFIVSGCLGLRRKP